MMATETGYTRAQLADAVDEAHEALHELEDETDRAMLDVGLHTSQEKILERAHEALHRVGAGLPRVGCATQDPEAQAILADLIAARSREIPCGHTLGTSSAAPKPTGGPVSPCVALASVKRQPEVALWNRLRRAWKASGKGLGRLIDEACWVYAGASGGHRNATDEALVDMCERYVQDHPVTSEEQA